MQRDFAPGVERQLPVALIERAELPPAAGEVRELDDFAGLQGPGDFAFARNDRAFADLDDFHLAHFGDGDRVFDVEFRQRGDFVIGRQLVLEGQIVSALGFREPAPPLPAAERDVPFVPDPARRVADLRPAGDFKRHAFELPPQPALERRVSLGEIRHFAQVFEFSVRPPYGGMATRADGDHRIGHIKLNRRTTGRTRGLKTHKFALFPTTSGPLSPRERGLG